MEALQHLLVSWTGAKHEREEFFAGEGLCAVVLQLITQVLHLTDPDRLAVTAHPDFAVPFAFLPAVVIPRPAVLGCPQLHRGVVDRTDILGDLWLWLLVRGLLP